MFKILIGALLALAAAASFAAVDVNKAEQAALDGVEGIGPALATRMLEERKKGNFKDWNDLIQRVRGVGAGNAARFSAAGLTVNDAAYAAAPAAGRKSVAGSTGKSGATQPAVAKPAPETKKADAPAR